MRDKILDIAKKLFIENGFNSVSVRKISSKLGYSPSAMYRYFDSKEELILSLKKEGFKRFYTLSKSVDGINDPFEKLFIKGESYLLFAKQEPEYFKLIFNRSAPSFCSDEKWFLPPGIEFQNLKQIVSECVDTGKLGNVNKDVVLISLWSAVHGLACLVASDVLAKAMPHVNIEEALNDVLNIIVYKPAINGSS